MTDKNNDYYQPWARDPAEPPRAGDAGAPEHGLAKPDDLPPVGMDLSRYAEEEKLPRAPLIDGEKLKENTAIAAQKLRSGASKFAAWTIALGQKADIPARLEALELPRRTKEMAKRSGTAAAAATSAAEAATRTAAKNTAKASKASAEKSAEVWQKMAIPEKVSKISSDAGRGLSEMADKTKSGIGQVAKAGKDSLGEKAGKLLPTKPDDENLPPPPSGLEQLLEREAEAENHQSMLKQSTQNLPLFAENEKPVAAPAEQTAAVSETPVVAEAAVAAATPAAVDDAVSPVTSPVTPPAAIPTPTPVTAPAAPAQEAAPVVAAPAEPVAAAPAPLASAPASHSLFPADAAPAQPKAKTTEKKPDVPPYEVTKNAPAAYQPSESFAAGKQPPSPARQTGWQPSGRTLALSGAVLAVLLGSSAYLGSRFGGGLSKADVETIVGDYITANPQVIPAALEAQRNQEMAKAIDTVRPALEKPYAGAWGGNADGDVTLVVFTDYACGFCRASVPDIDRLIREDKRLKVVYRELPIISRESRNAALMALMAARQGKYDAFHHAMFAQSSLSPTAIMAAAEKSGVTLDGSGDTTADEALFQRELESNLALATELQLNATPTWVIGTQLLQGQVGYRALQDAVAKARAQKSS